ncbi:hypothetical protein DFH07DRAFT_832874 [Mycena maculata]|uniref:Uncharacterized protein n=1 Tax=Mycena maculata TaxID=230809 RepID=A0AAD7N5A7_9AGAR|nr:hypothetical protein DFH07DRAFT_832874 [Mycena maculata]
MVLIPFPSTRARRSIDQLHSALDDLNETGERWIYHSNATLEILEDKITEYTILLGRLSDVTRYIAAKPKRAWLNRGIRNAATKISERVDVLQNEIKTTSERLREQTRFARQVDSELDLSTRPKNPLSRRPPPPAPPRLLRRLGIIITRFDTTRLREELKALKRRQRGVFRPILEQIATHYLLSCYQFFVSDHSSPTLLRVVNSRTECSIHESISSADHRPDLGRVYTSMRREASQVVQADSSDDESTSSSPPCNVNIEYLTELIKIIKKGDRTIPAIIKIGGDDVAGEYVCIPPEHRAPRHLLLHPSSRPQYLSPPADEGTTGTWRVASIAQETHERGQAVPSINTQMFPSEISPDARFRTSPASTRQQHRHTPRDSANQLRNTSLRSTTGRIDGKGNNQSTQDQVFASAVTPSPPYGSETPTRQTNSHVAMAGALELPSSSRSQCARTGGEQTTNPESWASSVRSAILAPSGAKTCEESAFTHGNNDSARALLETTEASALLFGSVAPRVLARPNSMAATNGSAETLPACPAIDSPIVTGSSTTVSTSGATVAATSGSWWSEE